MANTATSGDAMSKTEVTSLLADVRRNRDALAILAKEQPGAASVEDARAAAGDEAAGAGVVGEMRAELKLLLGALGQFKMGEQVRGRWAVRQHASAF